MSQMNNGIRGFVAAAAIGQYLQVKIDTAGKAALAGAGDVPDGMAEIGADSGGEVSVRLHNFPGTRKVVMAGACSIGDLLYTAASGKLSTTPVSGPAVFKAIEAATANGDIIEAMPLDQSSGGSAAMGANLADSTAAGTSSTSEVVFDKKVTIPAGGLQAGDILQIRASFKATATHSTDTFNFKLYVATELIQATGAVDLADNGIAYIDALVTVRADGSGGKLSASGVVGIGVEGTATAKPFVKEEASEDISGAVDITASVTCSASDVGNAAVLEDLQVIRHRA